MPKQTIKCDCYKRFVQKHILRPYQECISDQEKSLNFADIPYDLLALLISENPKWAFEIFDRISRIYREIDSRIFPVDYTSGIIIEKLREHGVLMGGER